MKTNFKKFITIIIPTILIILNGCGSDSASEPDPIIPPVITIKMGFTDFDAKQEYLVETLTYIDLQKAINSASAAGGGTVIIPQGEILISSAISLKGNVKLKGTLDKNGARLSILKCKENSLYGNDGLIQINGIKNVTVENLIIDVNNCHTMGIAALYGASNFLVANNEVKNMGTAKINVVSGDRDVPPQEDNPTGINMWEPGESFTIKDNTIKNAAKHGININMPDNKPRGHFIIENNKMENCFMGLDVSSNCKDVSVIKNEITDCIFGLKIVSSVNVTVENNKIYNLDPRPYYWDHIWEHDSGTPLVLQNNVNKITIKNNQLTPTAGREQIVQWDVPAGAIITIQNNSQ